MGQLLDFIPGKHTVTTLQCTSSTSSRQTLGQVHQLDPSLHAVSIHPIDIGIRLDNLVLWGLRAYDCR